MNESRQQSPVFWRLWESTADPISSREHILLSNVLDQAWRGGQDLDMASLIHAVQSPAFQKVGVMDIETFFPAKDRFAPGDETE